MWERWNQATKIFEKSTDNGASWSPLGLDASIITQGTLGAARLPANVALKDAVNVFTKYQTIAAEPAGASEVRLYDNTQPVDRRLGRVISYAGNLYLVLTDDAITINHNQLILAADNTVRLTGSIFERNRSVALGEWQNVPFVASDYFGTGGLVLTVGAGDIVSKYTLIGRTMHWQLKISAGDLTGTASNAIYVKIPGGMLAGNHGMAPARMYNGAWVQGGGEWVVGSNQIQFTRTDYGNLALGTDLLYIYSSLTLEI